MFIMNKYYKFLFIILFGLFIFLPNDTFAQDINSSGWYSGYKDYYGKPVNTSLSIIDIGEPYGFSGGTINESVSYVVLDKSITYTDSIVGSLNYYDKINYISELNLYANASFKKDSFYTINFKFNSGSYIVYDFENLRWFESNILMFDGNDYTTAVSSSSMNVDYDYSTFSGVISVTFKATISSDYVQIRIGDHNYRYASRLIYNNQDLYDNGFRIYLLNVDESQSLSDALLGQIAGQNNTIINQNQQIIDNSNKTNEKLDEAEETRKGIWETIKELPTMFLDMLLGLFIPDDFSFLDNLKESLEDKLGFIAEIPISVLDFILNLANADWDSFDSITLPTIEVFGVSFWDSQEISLQPAIDIFEPYKYFTDILCVILCVNTLLRWYHSFSNGGGN